MQTHIAGNLQTRQSRPHARSIKKHSEIMRRNAKVAAIAIPGEREKTDYGFIVAGFKGKNFETRLEVMLEETSTPVLRHEKKDRTVRVMSGSLVVVTDEVKMYHPGQEAVLERGTSYRLIAPKEACEFLVVQSPKYEVSLEVVDTSEEATAEVSADLMDGYTAPPTDSANPRRKGSKARQQALSAAARKNSTQTVQKLGQAPKPTDGPAPVSAVEGLSPQPSMGNFDDSTAG